MHGGRDTFELNKPYLGLWILKTDFIYGIPHCYFLQEAISQVMPHTTATAFDCEFSVLYALHVLICLFVALCSIAFYSLETGKATFTVM